MLGSDSGTGGVDSSLNIAGFLSQVGRSPTRDTVKRAVRQSTELCRSEGNNIGARRNYTLLRGGPLSSVTHNQPPHSETPTIALARKGIALSIRMDRLQSRIIE